LDTKKYCMIKNNVKKNIYKNKSGLLTPDFSNHYGDKKVKHVPAISPETPEPINPLDNNLNDKDSQH